MIIKMHKSDFMWSVTWTLDGQTWRTQAFDLFSEALNLAARIGSMEVQHENHNQ